MSDLQDTSVDDVFASFKASPEFDAYDEMAKVFNQKNANQLTKLVVQEAIKHPELIMAL